MKSDGKNLNKGRGMRAFATMMSYDGRGEKCYCSRLGPPHLRHRHVKHDWRVLSGRKQGRKKNTQPLSGVVASVKGQLERITPVPAAVMYYNEVLYYGTALCLIIVTISRGFNSPPISKTFAKQQSSNHKIPQKPASVQFHTNNLHLSLSF